MAELDIPPQAKQQLANFSIVTVSDFLCYDCQENTNYPSYGIIPLKIGKNSKKRIYDELANKGIPRAFTQNDCVKPLNLETPIFEIPLEIATINKLYRCGLLNLEDCLTQSIFTKKCLGDNYDDLTNFIAKLSLKINHVPVSDQLRLIDIELPKRLNVLKDGQIKKDHMVWQSERYEWACEAKYYGLETIGDVKKIGYDDFVKEHGFILDSFFHEYEITMPGYEKSSKLQELQEMRLMIDLLLDVYDGSFAKDQEQDVVNFVKRKVRKSR